MIDKCCLKFTGEVVVFGSGTASQCCDHQIGLQGADMKGRFIGPSIAGCRYGRTGSNTGYGDRDCESERFSPHEYFP